jgi:hypothetical protein
MSSVTAASGWRSARPRPSWLPERKVPKFLADAPNDAVYETRERALNRVSENVGVSVDIAASLIEKALPLIEGLPREDHFAMHNAVCHAEAAYCLKALSANGADVCGRRYRESLSLAAELAAKLTPPGTDLCATVAHLLAHPLAPESQ